MKPDPSHLRLWGSDPQLPEPSTILDDPSLTRAQKIAQLRQLRHDALELDVATEEGMTGAEGLPSNLERIQAALRELGARDAIAHELHDSHESQEG